ncbi:tyrosine-type recombinase/integrase [Paenibacillus sp. Marseille-Q4541]|uniref:site-specific integrase n=1 Tax=Paenibacillus sp. Marseille-Q4541 TaxID=2831522 RepID=UPI001BADFBA9|nr:tyrosine-type recombinase/integrase [Paenibacillus sp. Marseille-Q4541]
MSRKYKNVRERNGKFYYRYDSKDPATGKRIQKEIGGFATAKEAEREGIKIQAEKIHGIYIDEKKITLAEWIDEWLEIYKATGKVKQRTVDQRKSTLNAAKKIAGGLKLIEITPLFYQTLLNDLINSSKNYSYGYIKNFHTVMNMLFTEAVKKEIIKKDPTANIEIPRKKLTVDELENLVELPEYLEKEELAKLFIHAKNEIDRPQLFRAIYILAYTGMRIGELCALKLTDIDELHKRISITKTLYVPRGIDEYVLNTPKNHASIRKIDISSRVLTIIKEQIAWRNKFKMEYRKWFYDGPDFLFINENRHMGCPYPPGELRKHMAEVVSKAGLPPSITPHSLRHTYTSLMAEAGVELPAIQKLLGHSSDEITETVYLHVTNARKRAAVEKLDALMDNLW